MFTRLSLFALGICLLATVASAGNESDAVIAGYQAAMAAYQEENYEARAAELRGVLELVPGHPIIRRHPARAHARMGEKDEALDWLERERHRMLGQMDMTVILKVGL